MSMDLVQNMWVKQNGPYSKDCMSENIVVNNIVRSIHRINLVTAFIILRLQ